MMRRTRRGSWVAILAALLTGCATGRHVVRPQEGGFEAELRLARDPTSQQEAPGAAQPHAPLEGSEQEAVAVLWEAARLAPGDASVRLELAEWALKRGELGNALGWLRAAQRRGAADELRGRFVRLARRLLDEAASRDYSDAVLWAAGVLDELAPRSYGAAARRAIARAWAQRAGAALRAERWRDALDAAGEALQRGGPVEVHRVAAVAAAQLGDVDAAKRHAQAYVDGVDASKRAGAACGLAKELRERFRLRVADELAQRCAKLSPTPEHWWLAAQLALARQDVGRAVVALEARGRAVPGDERVDALLDAAGLLARYGHEREAEAFAERAREAAPGDVRPVVMLARWWVRAGKRDAARDVLVEFAHHHAAEALRVAEALRSLGFDDAAASLVREEAGKGHVEAWLELAQWAWSDGNAHEADKFLRRYVRAAHGNALALARAAGLRASWEQTKAAIALYQRALQRDPAQREAALGLAKLWVRRGEVDKAVETIRAWSQALADPCQGWLEGGRALRSLSGEDARNAVVRLVEAALEASPDAAKAKQAKGQCSAAQALELAWLRVGAVGQNEYAGGGALGPLESAVRAYLRRGGMEDVAKLHELLELLRGRRGLGALYRLVAEKLAEKAPGERDVWFEVGLARLRMGARSEAVEAFGEWLSRGTDPASDLRKLLAALVAHGALNLVEQLPLDEIPAFGDHAAEVYQAIGEAWAAPGPLRDVALAAKYFDKAMQLSDRTPAQWRASIQRFARLGLCGLALEATQASGDAWEQDATAAEAVVQCALRLGVVGLARRAMDVIVRERGGGLDVVEQLAGWWMRGGWPGRGADVLLDAYRRAPVDARRQVLDTLARALFMAGRRDEIPKVLEELGDSDEALEERARQLEEYGFFAQAAATWKRLGQARALDVEGWSALVSLLLRAGDTQGAAKAARQWVRETDSDEARLQAAKELARYGLAAEALRLVEGAEGDGGAGGGAALQQLRIEFLLDRGRYGEAQSAALEGVARARDPARFALGLRQAFERAGQWNALAGILAAAAARDDTASDLWAARVAVALRRHRDDEARRLADEASQRAPQAAMAVAMALARGERVADALDVYERALGSGRIFDADGKGLPSLASALLWMGRGSELGAIVGRYRAAATDRDAADRAVASLWLAVGKARKALDVLDKLMKEMRDDPRAALFEVQVALAAGDRERAVAEVRRAMRMGGRKSPEAVAEGALAVAAAGGLDDARDILRKAVQRQHRIELLVALVRVEALRGDADAVVALLERLAHEPTVWHAAGAQQSSEPPHAWAFDGKIWEQLVDDAARVGVGRECAELLVEALDASFDWGLARAAGVAARAVGAHDLERKVHAAMVAHGMRPDLEARRAYVRAMRAMGDDSLAGVPLYRGLAWVGAKHWGDFVGDLTAVHVARGEFDEADGLLRAAGWGKGNALRRLDAVQAAARRLQRWDVAREALDAMVQLAPHLREPWVRGIEVALAAGDDDDAWARARRWLERTHGDLKEVQRIAELFEKARRPALSLRVVEELLRQQPGRASLHLRAVRLALAAFDLAAARRHAEAYRKAVDSNHAAALDVASEWNDAACWAPEPQWVVDDDRWRVLSQRARTQLLLGHVDEAIETLHAAAAAAGAREAPRLVGQWATLALSTPLLPVEPAARLAHEALQVVPTQPDALLVAGVDAARRHRVEAAREMLIRAVRDNPNWVPALDEAVRGALEADQVALGAELLQEYGREVTTPQRVAARMLDAVLGEATRREAEGNPEWPPVADLAAPALELGRRLADELGDWFVTLSADVLEHSGHLDEAIELFERAMRWRPYSSSLYNNAAYMLARRGQRIQTALKWVRRAERLGPSDNVYYLDTEGWVLYRQGHLAQAERLVRASLAQVTDRRGGGATEALWHLGRILEDQGRLQEAARVYVESARSGWSDPWGRAAWARAMALRARGIDPWASAAAQ